MKIEQTLWGKKIVYDIRAIALHDLQKEYQNKVKKDINEIMGLRKREEVAYILKIFLKLRENINETGLVTKKVLNKYGIDYEPNWEAFNTHWENRIDRIQQEGNQFSHMSWYEETGGDIHGEENLRRNYRKAMSESDGLGWGIITNSIADAIWYTIVSETHKANNQAKAWEYASKSNDDFFDDAMDAHNANLKNYFDTVEFPEIMNLLGDYYTEVVELIKTGIGVFNEEEFAFSITKSNEIIEKDNITKDDILNALMKHPANGNVFIAASNNNLLDEELMHFLANLDSEMINSIYQCLADILKKSYAKCNVFNFNFLEEEIETIVKSGMKFFSITGNKHLWKKLVYEVYGERLGKVEEKFKYIKSFYDSKEKRRERILNNGEKASDDILDSITAVDKRIFAEFSQGFGLEELKKYIPNDFSSDEDLINIIDLYLENLKEIFDNEILSVEQEKHERNQKIKSLQIEIDEKEKLVNALGFALFGQKRKEKNRLLQEIINLKAEISKLKNIR